MTNSNETTITNETVENSNDLAMVNFSIPNVDKLAGVDETTALQTTLAKQAELFAEKAAKLTKAIKETLKPFFSTPGGAIGVFADYGTRIGQLEGEEEGEYYKKTVTVKTPQGVTVKAPVSLVFSNTAEMIVRYLATGGIPLEQFEEFKFHQAMLRYCEAHSNAPKGSDAKMKPVETPHGQFYATAQVCGFDTGGQLVGFGQVLALAAKAVWLSQNELHAMQLIQGVASKTGIEVDVLQTIVQCFVDATCAKGFKKLARDYAEKAKLTSQQREQKAKAQAEVAAGKAMSTLVARPTSN